ncbi:hypothetical protein ACFQX4_23365 [Roseomonas sp. GCM10028921]
MTPPAFLALWNGVVPERRAEYEAWHSIEHTPERIGAPGFRSVHRYRAEEGADYFTFYELDGLEALETAEYAALMQEPTAWSRRMRPALTGFRRLPCRTLHARRFGQGGAAATLRIGAEGEAVLPLLGPVLKQAIVAGRILGVVLGAASAVGRAYPVFPNAPAPRAESLLFLDATEPSGLPPVVEICLRALSGLTVEASQWRLLQSLRRDQLANPSAARQASREDLRVTWDGPGSC